jgi:hydrogenase maturation protease
MIRVIGLGSPFGDDDAGWRVIDAMRGRVGNAVELVALDRPGAALVNALTGATRLVLVDAVWLPGCAGRLLALTPDDLAEADPVLGTHRLGLAEQLALAAVLGDRPQRVEIWGISIDAPGGRSEAVGRTVVVLAERLVSELGVSAGR